MYCYLPITDLSYDRPVLSSCSPVLLPIYDGPVLYSCSPVLFYIYDGPVLSSCSPVLFSIYDGPVLSSCSAAMLQICWKNRCQGRTVKRRRKPNTCTPPAPMKVSAWLPWKRGFRLSCSLRYSTLSPVYRMIL